MEDNRISYRASDPSHLYRVWFNGHIVYFAKTFREAKEKLNSLTDAEQNVRMITRVFRDARGRYTGQVTDQPIISYKVK